MTPAQSVCKSCETPLQGSYCHQCGEKWLTEDDKSARKWLSEFVSSIWMLDGKLLRTLKALLLNPGKLAKDFISGRRKPYVKPLNIFLIANLLYFLSPAFDTFKTTLHSQRYNMPYSPVIERVIETSLENKGYDYESFKPVYDKKTAEVSKLIIIVLAPLIGILFYWLFQRQGLYLSDGFNLGFQFWAFFMLIFMITLPYISRVTDSLFGYPIFASELVVSLSALTISGVYLFFQLKPWGGKRVWLYTLKVLLLIVAFLPLITIYRFILFWGTIAFV